MGEGVHPTNIFTSQSDNSTGLCSSPSVAAVVQKLIAEAIGAYFIIFAWCGSVVMSKLYDDSTTDSGIGMSWGAVVMVMIYSVGQISGGHFNPAVTIIFTIFRRFPWKLAPLYIIAQLIGSILATVTLSILLDVNLKAYFENFPKVG